MDNIFWKIVDVAQLFKKNLEKENALVFCKEKRWLEIGIIKILCVKVLIEAKVSWNINRCNKYSKWKEKA